MAVATAERRRGIGKQLLREAERVARAWGYGELMLEVACENDSARDFYARQGYRVAALGPESSGVGATVVRSRGFYWQVETVDKCLMKKPLSSV